MMGMVPLSGSWLYNTKLAAPCLYAPCEGNTEEAVIHDVDVSITVSFDSGTMTRSAMAGGGCCYTRTGTATVTYAINIVDKGACCHHPNDVCTVTTYMSGSREVDYCHSMIPHCLKGTTCVWLHTTSLCPFYLQVKEVLNAVGAGDCSDLLSPLDCENLPLDRVGIAVGGARWQWWSAYQAPDTLDPIDFKDFTFCPLLFECGCDHDTVSARGPFSLYYLPDWGGSPPADCTDPGDAFGTLYHLGSWTNCGGDVTSATTACTGDLDFDDTCCTREFHFNVSPPYYT